MKSVTSKDGLGKRPNGGALVSNANETSGDWPRQTAAIAPFHNIMQDGDMKVAFGPKLFSLGLNPVVVLAHSNKKYKYCNV